MNAIQKYELIRPILKDEKTPKQVSKEKNVSLITVYRYLKRFRKGNRNMESLTDKSHAIHKHSKWFSRKDKDKVVQYKLQHPHFSSHQIAKVLTNEGILKISHNPVAGILEDIWFDHPLFADKSSELKDLSQPEKVSYLLSLKEQETSVMAISEQYDVPRSTFYHWLSRYDTYHTYENRSTAPHKTHGKVTEDVKVAVLEKHRKNPRLGSWRLSLCTIR